MPGPTRWRCTAGWASGRPRRTSGISAAAIDIAGAGPAGLAAAIAVARRGGRARVVEPRADAGARFHGDFQGIENWTTGGDVLEELAALGIEPNFAHQPFRECVLLDGDGRLYECRSPEPLWYLVRRGTAPDTLDQALKRRALAAGVELEFGVPAGAPPTAGIVTRGPHRGDVIAVGYVGRTDAADAAYAVLSEQLAPRGYAYLLIWHGEATLATCMFADLRHEALYLDRTVEFFRTHLGVSLVEAKRFGGYGTVPTRQALRQGAVLYAGEAAGLQDPFLGFGMRYALVSGHLAGAAYAAGDLASYERACARRLVPLVRAGLVNRRVYDRAPAEVQRRLLRGVSTVDRPREWLRRYVGPRWWTPLLYPWARRRRGPARGAAP